MEISHDSNSFPVVSQEMLDVSAKEALRIVFVVCDSGEQGNPQPGVAFVAMGPFLPRVGELLKLEDRNYCRVHEVAFSVNRLNKFPALIPTIYGRHVR